MNLLFNLADVRELLRNFYTLTGIRTAIFDHSFHELAAYPTRLSTYCHIIRSDPRAEAACIRCDQEACSKVKNERRLYTYECHAGLTETVVPIQADNQIIGYLMFGQLLQTGSREALWDRIYQNVSSYDLDMNKLYNAFQRKKHISKSIIEAYARTMEMSASYLYLSRMLILKQDTLAQKIDGYITEHIKDDLSVSVLCKQFNISKSHLYKLSEQSFGVGIAEHIRNIRIQLGKKLLGDTDCPIYEIAEQVGIPDYNYFTKAFKRLTGILPSAYRKENRAIQFGDDRTPSSPFQYPPSSHL
ncbi:PocR ligand-binding domain-containing protein [Paenibacillus sp. YN15]|uniref:PocR ligand-binding domain-containing protein n=1 Tax=Paenibacillus sp. YN15 TaxID=1742774 RepID=UPI0015EBD4B1|nr:PocR ligand-binding domain-containing protein [Paenibacillus sp. YN15]